jgi:hypothetical protein
MLVIILRILFYFILHYIEYCDGFIVKSNSVGTRLKYTTEKIHT